VRDYVYGPDVAAANLAALTLGDTAVPAGQLISLNIGTGIGTDVNELEALLRLQLQKQLEGDGHTKPLPTPEFGPARAGDLRSNLLAIERAASVLSWQPTTDLAAGVAATARWFHEQAQQ
jgi:UDP-glucose 4-epimerase